MKRWLAGLLTVILLMTLCAGMAEEKEGPSKADIQESMESIEGETVGTLAENLLFLRKMMEDEEIKNLFQIQDVKDLTSEVIWKTLVWLYQNRPVTMKIMAELGVGEGDRQCVEKIWDSAERISKASQEYALTEDGQRLKAELTAVKEDPEIQKSLENFFEMIDNEDVSAMLEAIQDVSREVNEEKLPEGELTQEALARQMDRTSFTGQLIFRLMGLIEQSEWARESLPALLKNEKLWTALTHLAQGDEADKVRREEISNLMTDPEMNDFFKRTTYEVISLMKMFRGAEEETDRMEKQPADDHEATKEETAP